MEEPTGPSVDVVIVNWNGGDQVLRCVRSVFANVPVDIALGQVIVIDNASSDASAQCLSTWAEQSECPVRLVQNPTNVGFGAACNQGAALGESLFILFLNPDTELNRSSLSLPVRTIASRPEVGVCSIQLLDDEGKVSRNAARFPSPRGIFGRATGLDRLLPGLFPPHYHIDWQHDETRFVDQVMGAFFLVRRSDFDDVGGFDERFFMYYEEVDLAKRLSMGGMNCLFVAGATAYHKGGGTTESVKSMRLMYTVRSRILYAEKHFSRKGAAVVRFASLYIEPFVRLGYGVAVGDFRACRNVVEAYRRLWMSEGVAHSLRRVTV